MADAADDVQAPDITLDDFDGESQDAPTVDPSPTEPKDTETAEADKPAEEGEAETPPEGEPAEEEDGDQQPEDKQFAKADERKNALNSEIRDLVAQRNELKKEVEKANSEAYQPATEEELEAEGLSSVEAKVEAMRQREEVREYNNQVAEAQLTIESESQRVLREFPMFDPSSDQYNEEIRDQAAELLQANLIFDPNTGQVIGSNVSPYQLYKTIATAAGISAQKGQIAGQKATERMLANADSPGSAAPAKKPIDPVLALWQEDD
jgi:hypothetical protein